ADPVAAIRTYIRQKVIFSRDNPEASRLFCLEIVQGAPRLGPALRGALKAVVDAKAGVIRAWVASARLAPVDPHHLL
ncbi:TetR family transcriptional regulator C-terminal domain-containing protein, partial [Acinetobacter baumannii]